VDHAFSQADAARRTDAARRLQRALKLAYAYLARRARSVAEVRRHLRSRGVGEEAAEGALAELRHQGYLDDARYARALAEDRRHLDGWGAERIRERLHAAGIPPALIEQAVAEDPQTEIAAAVDLLRRRMRAAPADDGTRQRALGLLIRKGYDADVAYEAIRRFERAAEPGHRAADHKPTGRLAERRPR